MNNFILNLINFPFYIKINGVKAATSDVTITAVFIRRIAPANAPRPAGSVVGNDTVRAVLLFNSTDQFLYSMLKGWKAPQHHLYHVVAPKARKALGISEDVVMQAQDQPGAQVSFSSFKSTVTGIANTDKKLPTPASTMPQPQALVLMELTDASATVPVSFPFAKSVCIF